MSNVPYLGSKISLISKSEIRYEGILYSVDAKESTVALAKVKSFGTEGRPTDRPVAPRDEVYEYIIFRASDIKDLHVCEAKSEHGLPHDPAIVLHSPAVAPQPSLHYGQTLGALYGLPSFQHLHAQASFPHIPSIIAQSHYSGSSSRSTTPTQRKSPTSDAGVQVSVGGSENIRDNRSRREASKERYRPRGEQAPNYQNRWRNPSQSRQPSGRRNVSRRGRGRPAISRTVEKFESEFDFEQANAEFLELETKLSKASLDNVEASSPDDQNAYDRQKSFFDDISCEASQRSKGLPRFDWRIERKMNVETFGVSANNAWMRRRRARGGFRRGYRGRGNISRQSSEGHKTVTFNETPVIKEVEVITVDEKSDQMPVIEIVEKEKVDWPEQGVKGENVWKATESSN